MYRYIGRAIFTNKTNHYGLKWRQDHVRQFAGGGILVIRNPYTAIISFWNYEKTRTHSVFAEKNSFCSVQFREFAFKSISRCRSVTDVYTDRCCRKKMGERPLVHYSFSLSFAYKELNKLSPHCTGKQQVYANHTALSCLCPGGTSWPRTGWPGRRGCRWCCMRTW